MLTGTRRREVSLIGVEDSSIRSLDGVIVMSSRATWTITIAVVVLAGFGFVAVRAADGDLPNTGMADPVALVSAFDRFAAGGAPANVVILSLSNLRGVSSEAVNAGGRVQVNLATGSVDVHRPIASA